MLFKAIFSPIEWKKGLICGVIIALVLSGFGFAQTFESSQLQWTAGVSGKLLRGEVLSYNGYAVQVAAFPAPAESAKYRPEPEEPVEPFVGLNISKNGSFIGNVVLGLGESYIVPDGELRITANELPAKNAREWLFESYAPWAVIELNPRGTPRLGVSIQTDKDVYVSSYTADVIATVQLENTGTADAVNVDLVIDTELPVYKGSLKYHYDKIKIGESVTETITFTSPVLAEPKTYGISTNVKGYDVMGIPYTATSSKSISVVAELPVTLSIKKSTVDKMYLKDYTIISLSVKNNGRYDAKNVNITDSIPDSFRLLGDQPLHWVVDIPVNEVWEYRYLVRPQEASKEGIVFPAATAEFTVMNEFYSVRSNQPKIIVYGPNIVLNKQTDVSEFNPGDTVTVTVVAENTGSTPTRVIIIDSLPDKVTLISGSTSREEFLEATMKMSFSYTLRIDSKESITLPAVIADYYELGSKGRRISTKSQELEVPIKSAKKTPVPTVILTPAPPAVTSPKKTPVPAVVLTPAPPAVTSPVKPAKTLDERLREVYNFLSSMLGFGKPQVNLSISKITVDNMLLKDYTSISLSVKNNETYDLKNVIITDSIPESFRLLANYSLHWTVDIPAGGEWNYRYLVRPQEPSKEGIVFPAATAEFTVNNKLYSIQSNQLRILVKGPKIVIGKQTDASEVRQGGTVNITIVAENTGNAPTRVIIMDALPNNVTLVSGNTTMEGILEANMKLIFNYTLRIDSRQPLKLPPAIADYYEFGSKGRKITTKSKELEIRVKPAIKVYGEELFSLPISSE